LARYAELIELSYYLGPCRIILEGGDSERYIGMARTVLGGLVEDLDRGGLAYGVRSRRLESANIFVQRYGGGHQIFITSGRTEDSIFSGMPLFLESGWCYLPNIFPDESAVSFPDGRVYLTHDHPSIGYDLVHFSADGWKQGKRRGYSAGMLSRAIADMPKAYQVRDFWWGKSAPGYISAQTGKIKLLAQSLLGSLRTTGETIGYFGWPGALEGSRGIYTTSDYEYFLIEISSSKIGYRKLALMDSAIPVQRFLKRNAYSLSPLQLRVAEAYLLSTADMAATFSVSQIDISFSEGKVEGLPLQYGWKFSWLGRKAMIVTLQNIGNGYNSADWNFAIIGAQSRHYEVSILERALNPSIPESSSNPRFSLECNVIESVFWTPDTRSIMWLPVAVQGGIYGGLSYVRDPYIKFKNPVLVVADAPVYGWYDHSGLSHGHDSRTIMVRHQRQWTHGVNEAPSYSYYLLSRYWSMLSTISGETTGSKTIAEDTAPEEHGMDGFYIDGICDMRYPVTRHINEKIEYTAGGRTDSAPIDQVSYHSESPWNGYIDIHLDCGHSYVITEAYGEESYGVGYLIVPLRSAEAAYIGKLETWDASLQYKLNIERNIATSGYKRSRTNGHTEYISTSFYRTTMDGAYYTGYPPADGQYSIIESISGQRFYSQQAQFRLVSGGVAVGETEYTALVDHQEMGTSYIPPHSDWDKWVYANPWDTGDQWQTLQVYQGVGNDLSYSTSGGNSVASTFENTDPKLNGYFIGWA
jgi:hypothetical protein